MLEEVFRSFTYEKVVTPQCRNTLLQLKAMHVTFYLSKSTGKIQVLVSTNGPLQDNIQYILLLNYNY